MHHLDLYIISGGSRGAPLAHAPLGVLQILLFWHTNLLKRSRLGSWPPCLRGRHPPMGNPGSTTDNHSYALHIYIYIYIYIYICDVCHAEDDVSPRWWYASEDVNLYSRNSAHGHQPKEDGPVRTARKVFGITLKGCVAYFGASTLGETLTIITTQSSIVEGSRLQKRGTHQRIDPSMHEYPAVELWTEVKWTLSPRWGKSLIGHARRLI